MERDIVWSSAILGPLLFNILLCDMFYFLEDCDIAYYEGDSTPHCADESAEFVVNNLQQSSTILLTWLNNNYMKVNTVKSHLLLSGNSRATATIGDSYIESEDQQVNSIHERTLRITYQNNASTFQELLNKGNSV